MNFGLPVAPHLAYLTEALEVFLTSTVEIVRPGKPVYDPMTGTAASASGGPGYTGVAQVTRSSSAGAVLSGESYAEISTVRVSIPQDALPLPRMDDQVLVTACPDDPALVNEVLRVIDVSFGGLVSPLRTLTCTFATATPFNPGS